MCGNLDRNKLARILGMLGSAHDGEVAAAGRAADALIRGAGLAWPEVLAGPAQPPPPPYREPRNNAETLDLCHSWRHVLSDWEQRFIASIALRDRLTKKQSDMVCQILDKVKYAARYAGDEAANA
jgi:hypothetical protein